MEPWVTGPAWPSLLLGEHVERALNFERRGRRCALLVTALALALLLASRLTPCAVRRPLVAGAARHHGSLRGPGALFEPYESAQTALLPVQLDIEGLRSALWSRALSGFKASAWSSGDRLTACSGAGGVPEGFHMRFTASLRGYPSWQPRRRMYVCILLSDCIHAVLSQTSPDLPAMTKVER
jgi:hypothetical protein